MDGKLVADKIISRFNKTNFVSTQPHLAIILVGDSPASLVYVSHKQKACQKAGFLSTLHRYPTSITEKELLSNIEAVNNDKSIHGFIVQLPLPPHIDQEKVIEAISPAKDVDGFHPTNIGQVFLGLREGFAPATPSGIIELLKHYSISTRGKHVCILGRSRIVGKPLFALLSDKGEYGDATVTLLHSRTRDLKTHTLQADIIIAAMGQAEMITADYIKEGAVVIDVGTNRVEDATRKRGYRIVGDVDYKSVVSKSSHITPVPGGVGPMTVAMLLQNTYKAYQQQEGLPTEEEE